MLKVTHPLRQRALRATLPVAVCTVLVASASSEYGPGKLQRVLNYQSAIALRVPVATMVVSPDGRFAYVTAEASGALTIVNLRTRSQTKLAIADYLTGVALSPNGARAYVTQNSPTNDHRSVYVLSTAKDKVVGRIDVGGSSFSVAVGPRGNTVFVSGNKTLSVINVRTNRVSKRIKTGIEADAEAVSDNGKYVYLASDFASTTRGQIPSEFVIVNLVTGRVTSTTRQGEVNPSSLVVAANGKAIYESVNMFATNSSLVSREIKIINPVSGKREGNFPIVASDITLGPHGKTLLASSFSSDELYVVDPASERNTAVTVPVKPPAVLGVIAVQGHTLYAASSDPAKPFSTLFLFRLPTDLRVSGAAADR